MRRYKIKIEYDGTPFVGWQRQENGLSVQESIENSISDLFQEQVTVFGAGRTDTGVHAMGQVGHFDILQKELDTNTILNGLNHHLRTYPISILEVDKVNEEFHARFNAKQRKYLYRIINRNSPLTIEKGRAWHVFKNLDVEQMVKCIPFIEGKIDFTTFRSAHCQAESPVKTMENVKINRTDDDIFFGFIAKSFLHHQVRSLVGSLKLVGDGTWTVENFKSAVEFRDRSKCGALAPPEGLYLMEVKY